MELRNAQNNILYSLFSQKLKRKTAYIMTKTTTTSLLLLTASSAFAFAPKQPNMAKATTTPAIQMSSVSSNQDPPLYDPLGLYPKNSPERTDSQLKPLEATIDNTNSVKDPLNLYKNNKDEIDSKPMSMSLPFLERPTLLDGSLPGDRGFDPFNFASTPDRLQWYRNAEVKHARLAQLAVTGWVASELSDRSLAAMFHLKPLLVFQDRVPSVLNGGLDRTPAIFWAAVLGTTFAIESLGFLKEQSANEQNGSYTPGDLGFDPLGLAGTSLERRQYMAEAELFNGRLAMMAITSFALQEWWFQNSIVNQFPIFFKPFWTALEQLQDQAGNGMM